MRRIVLLAAALSFVVDGLATNSVASPPAVVNAGGGAASRPMRIADLPLVGPEAFNAIARDVLDVVVSIDPSVAANAGMFDDALRVPSYSPASIAPLVARLDRALAALRALPWRSYSVDDQIDVRWVFANAETARRQLMDERIFEHRPSQWLEPLSNDLIALVSYAPERVDLQRAVLARVPAMVTEMRSVVKRHTRRDVDTAVKIGDALVAMAKRTSSREGDAAAAALSSYVTELKAIHPNADYEVVGAESYAWRYRHSALLPWTPEQLLHEAETALASADREIAALKPKLAPPAKATAAQEDEARWLSRDGLLGLYDKIQLDLRAATAKGNWVTIPSAVGPVRARETPDAMVPLTGDGGSMNPPPTYSASNTGYWNVEHFQGGWSRDQRIESVTDAEGYLKNGMGPYAAHEGFPGHHLQLSIARLQKDPLRSILPDGVENEGWGLYAEEALWQHGGLGDSIEAHSSILRSYRHRIMRVIYDVHIERRDWDLQRAADFKHEAAAGKGKIDEELLRSIQWPTQLVCYFAGKLEIVKLRDEWKRRRGANFDERAFHDALLAEGSVPIGLVRAKMLGEPVAGFDDAISIRQTPADTP